MRLGRGACARGVVSWLPVRPTGPHLPDPFGDQWPPRVFPPRLAGVRTGHSCGAATACTVFRPPRAGTYSLVARPYHMRRRSATPASLAPQPAGGLSPGQFMSAQILHGPPHPRHAARLVAFLQAALRQTVLAAPLGPVQQLLVPGAPVQRQQVSRLQRQGRSAPIRSVLKHEYSLFGAVGSGLVAEKLDCRVQDKLFDASPPGSAHGASLQRGVLGHTLYSVGRDCRSAQERDAPHSTTSSFLAATTMGQSTAAPSQPRTRPMVFTPPPAPREGTGTTPAPVRQTQLCSLPAPAAGPARSLPEHPSAGHTADTPRTSSGSRLRQPNVLLSPRSAHFLPPAPEVLLARRRKLSAVGNHPVRVTKGSRYT